LGKENSMSDTPQTSPRWWQPLPLFIFIVLATLVSIAVLAIIWLPLALTSPLLILIARGDNATPVLLVLASLWAYPLFALFSLGVSWVLFLRKRAKAYWVAVVVFLLPLLPTCAGLILFSTLD
jgi:hypothetical protein